MKFGAFDDAKREYVITTPETPLPWINYLGTERLFGLISNTGGGYSFYRDAKLRRLTRYRYNNVPADQGARCFYIRQGDELWSPAWQPVRRKLDSYSCRHGLGYTAITGARNGIEVEQLYLIPLEADVEICRVRVSNQRAEPCELDLFSYLEFCLWDAAEDDRNFQRNLSCGEVEVWGSTVYHKTEYRERRNHFAFYGVNRDVAGFDTDREAFVGRYGDLGSPDAVVNGRCGNSLASGWSPIAAHQIHLVLESGAVEEMVFVLGYVENGQHEKFTDDGLLNTSKAERLMDMYGSTSAVDVAMSELAQYWDERIAPYTVSSGDEKLNRMVNIWHPYQCMVTFNMSRSASLFESGVGRGMGFRDSNQDLLGFVHQIPERAKERILDIAATQLESGGAYHQYQPLTKRGNAEIGGNFNDDPQWLILAVGAYIRETGDSDILNVMVPYENKQELAQPLLDHLMRAHRFNRDQTGPHGLPLIGRADWNDCLNLNCFSAEPGESFQTYGSGEGTVAESVMIAGLYVFACSELSDLLHHVGQTSLAEEVKADADLMARAVREHGRDSAWFLRAYDAHGDKVGSDECEEGKIYIESQGWCIMAGLGVDDGFARTALDSVQTHLATPHGIMLQDPPYSQYHLELGEVSTYPPGYKENGGIFCHTNPWIIIAEALHGSADLAWDYYRRICPAYREELSDVHRCEPYVYAQMIAGKAAARHGEAKNSWLTGTAAWNYVAITQYLLGVRPGYDGLIIDPRIPASALPLNVTRRYRGTTYHIEIVAGEQRGMIVDGDAVAGKEVPHNHQSVIHVKAVVPAA